MYKVTMTRVRATIVVEVLHILCL